MSRQPENTTQDSASASPASPSEIIQDLRDRLTEAEKKLRGKSQEIRGLKERLRDTDSPARPTWAENLPLNKLAAFLVAKKVFRRNQCSICGAMLLWFKTAEKETRWRALTYEGTIHYHDYNVIQTARFQNSENQDNFNRKTALARWDRTKTFRAHRKTRFQTPKS